MTQNADPAELRKFGEQASAWWDPDGPFRTLHAINPQRVGYVADRAELAGAKLLDVGCGGGLFSEAAARRGARVCGIDLAPENIDAARDHAAHTGHDVEYRCASVEDLASAEPAAYDVVVCLELLEHVPDPESVIAACAAAARPGAHLFFSTLNRSPKSFAFAILGAEYVLGLLPRGTHEYAKFIRPAELARACRAVGIDVRELTGLHYEPLTRTCRLGGSVDVNYLLHAVRPVIG